MELKLKGCKVEDYVLMEFMSKLLNDDLLEENRFDLFKLAESYAHILNCEKHNEEFVEYVENQKDKKIISNLLGNVLYLSDYIHNGEEKEN